MQARTTATSAVPSSHASACRAKDWARRPRRRGAQTVSRAPWIRGVGSGRASVSRTKRRPRAATRSSISRTIPVRWSAKNAATAQPGRGKRPQRPARRVPPPRAPSTRLRRPAPRPAKRASVPTWNSRSASTEAAAREPATPQKVRRRAPRTSPPTDATGSSTLMPSRTKRRIRQAAAGAGDSPSRMRAQATPQSDHHERAHQRDAGEARDADPPEGRGHGAEIVGRHEPDREAEPDQRAEQGQAAQHARGPPGASRRRGRRSRPVRADGASRGGQARALQVGPVSGPAAIRRIVPPLVGVLGPNSGMRRRGSDRMEHGGERFLPGPASGSSRRTRPAARLAPVATATARFGQGPRQPDSTMRSFRRRPDCRVPGGPLRGLLEQCRARCAGAQALPLGAFGAHDHDLGQLGLGRPAWPTGPVAPGRCM